jgi:hypothetical protein
LIRISGEHSAVYSLGLLRLASPGSGLDQGDLGAGQVRMNKEDQFAKPDYFLQATSAAHVRLFLQDFRYGVRNLLFYTIPPVSEHFRMQIIVG